MNVTAVPRAPLGFISVFPTGQPRPVVSTLNSLDSRIVANAALLPAGTDGSIDVFADSDTDVVIDVNGYFAPGPVTSGNDFVPLLPCRIADSRRPLPVPFGRPFLGGGTSRDYPLFSSSCSIPVDASAFVMNMTVVPYGYLGYLTVWPSGATQPTVSTLNSFNGATIANAAIVPSGTPAGSISAFSTNDTELIIDTSGVFAPRSGQGQFYAVEPCRVVDTRLNTLPAGLGAPTMTASVNRTFPMRTSGCGISPRAIAYSLNFTVVPRGCLGYLIVWPAGSGAPKASTLNSPRGAILANAAIVPVGENGAITVFSSNDTELIIDINGYFAP